MANETKTELEPKTDKDEKGSAGDKLNAKQKRFGELYVTEREFFGNGIQSYAEAYGVSLSTKGTYQSAKSCASRLLTNVNLLAYINELLDLTLNEVHVDKQLAFLITQNADFGAKMAAIREFNALRSRVTQKWKGEVKGLTFADFFQIVTRNGKKDSEGNADNRTERLASGNRGGTADDEDFTG